MKRLITLNPDMGRIIVTKEEIMQTLFHRGRMLLLDQVLFADGEILGEFTVPSENCEGHEPMPGYPVMRGVEIIEMAFQLLGIMVSKDPELVALLKDKVFVAREAVGAKFGGFILPGDKLTLETQPYISIDEKVGTFLIESSRFSVNVNLKKRGTVAGVVIAAFNPAILSK